MTKKLIDVNVKSKSVFMCLCLFEAFLFLFSSIFFCFLFLLFLFLFSSFFARCKTPFRNLTIVKSILCPVNNVSTCQLICSAHLTNFVNSILHPHSLRPQAGNIPGTSPFRLIHPDSDFEDFPQQVNLCSFPCSFFLYRHLLFVLLHCFSFFSLISCHLLEVLQLQFPLHCFSFSS